MQRPDGSHRILVLQEQDEGVGGWDIKVSVRRLFLRPIRESDLFLGLAALLKGSKKNMIVCNATKNTCNTKCTDPNILVVFSMYVYGSAPCAMTGTYLKIEIMYQRFP